MRLGRPGLLDVDVHWVPWDEHYHLDLRFHVVAAGELAPDAAEVHAAEWVAWDDASRESRSPRFCGRSQGPVEAASEVGTR